MWPRYITEYPLWFWAFCLCCLLANAKVCRAQLRHQLIIQACDQKLEGAARAIYPIDIDRLRQATVELFKTSGYTLMSDTLDYQMYYLSGGALPDFQSNANHLRTVYAYKGGRYNLADVYGYGQLGEISLVRAKFLKEPEGNRVRFFRYYSSYRVRYGNGPTIIRLSAPDFRHPFDTLQMYFRLYHEVFSYSPPLTPGLTYSIDQFNATRANAGRLILEGREY